MKIVFMGTPDFAVPALNRIIQEYEVVGVFTQPDRPKGRGKKVSFSPIKEVAIKNNIPVYQPEKLRKEIEVIEKLRDLKPDFIIVVAYGQILPKGVIDIPKYGCINLHASLLPKFRGSAPINWAIIKGEEVSGNTTMYMDEGIDTGDMLLKSEIKITESMTAGDLHDILMQDGAELLIETIKGLAENTIKRNVQQSECPFYAKMLDKNIANINWNENAKDICNLIRGLNPWPVAFTKYKGEAMKIFKAQVDEYDSKCSTPGKILDVCKEGIKVSCGHGSILIEIIQFPGGKPLKIDEYLRGNSIEKGILLGD